MEIYTTPNWTFSAADNELLFSDGQSVQLAARHNACLLALLEAQGKTVDYDTLLLKVWGTQYRDTNTIASVISELRKRINCGDPKLKYIATVPKKGYRFNGFEHVSVLTEEEYNSRAQPFSKETEQSIKPSKTTPANKQSIALQTSTDIKPSQVNHTRRPLKKVYAAVIAGLALASLVIFVSRFSEDYSRPNFTQAPLTFELGLEYNFSISPDKRTLVYISKQKEKLTLVSKSLETGEKQLTELKSGLEISAFAFSQDSNSLAFVEHKNERSCLYISRVVDSKIMLNEKRLISKCEKQGYLMSVAFSNKDNVILYTKASNESDPYVIIKHDLTTGLQRNLTSPPTTGRGDYGTAISPDGTRIAFIRDLFWEKSSVWVMDLSSGETRKLFTKPYLIDKLSWYSNDEIIFAHDKELLAYSIKNLDLYSLFSSTRLPLYMASAVGDTIYLSQGNVFSAQIATLNLNNLSMSFREPNDYYEHTPTRPYENESFFFISNRSNRVGIWKSQQGQSQLLTDSKELKGVKSLMEAGEILLTTKPGKLLGINKLTGKISLLKDDLPNIKNFSYFKEKNKILYSKEVGESWYLQSLNLKSGKKELLGVSGYTGHFVGEKIYLTEFREPGLWRYNPYTRDKELLIPNFESYFSEKWSVTQDYIILLKDKEINVWKNGGKYQFLKTIPLESQPRRIKCDSNQCLIDLYALGNTSIIKLAKSH